MVNSASSDTQSGTILVRTPLDYDSPFSLSLLAEGDLVVLGTIRNSNTVGGDINLVAGWDGITGASTFDSGVFDAATLGSQTLFGKATNAAYVLNGVPFDTTGSVFIGMDTMQDGVGVGALTGDTRVYANSVVLRGSDNADAFNSFAQLGYNANGVVSDLATGTISVRAESDISLLSGTNFAAAAQIGHGGLNPQPEVASLDVNAAIVVELGGDLTMQSSGSTTAYTLIGHGTFDFGTNRTGGDRAGDITITAGGEISLEDNNFGSGAYIGHADPVFDAISSGDLKITAASIDQDASSTVAPGDDGAIDFSMLGEDLVYGNVEVTTVNSGLRLIGSTGSSSCECSDVTSAQGMIIRTSDALVLDSTFFYSNLGSGSIALVAGDGFFNEAGEAPLSTSDGKWVIYSTRPDKNTGDIGNLAHDFLAFGTAFDPSDPFGSTLPAGNGSVYSDAPVVTVESLTSIYGGLVATPGVTVTLNSDSSTISSTDFGFTVGSGFLDTSLVTFSSSGAINAGSYAGALTANISSDSGAVLSGVIFNVGTLTVDRAVLTGTLLSTPTKVYDGTTIANLTAGDISLSGFVASEGAVVTQTAGAFATADASSSTAVTVTLAPGDFTADSSTDLTNYLLPTTVVGSGAITQASLSGSIIGTPTKVYDGTTAAVLTGTDYLLTGFISGEGATVTQAAGSYATANASDSVAVSVTLAAGDFTADSGTNLANYVLPTVASGAGVISQAALSGSIIGTPTKVYDGTTAAVLTAANLLLSGFVTGEGASVTPVGGTYASADASATNSVTVTLAAGDFTADSGTNLANYVLPTVASGAGVISQAALSGSIIGTPTKVYDGTTAAVLTAANLLLSGFVEGEGASVTPVGGTYASADASATNSVTVTLAAGDFTADSGTNLANYVLPTVASGAGVISQAALSGVDHRDADEGL